MKPKEAWRAAVMQLQMEIPKPIFDERVRDARVLNFNGGIFTIGVKDAFTREWLENRLTSTFERHLRGTLNTDIVHVHFVVENPEITTGKDTEEVEEESVNTLHGEETQDGQDVAEIAKILPIQTDLHKMLTRPHAQTVIPAYFIRWLPFVGPDGGWFIVAMYQAFYFAENVRVNEENLSAKFTINRNWMATWSGLGERKIVTLLKNTSTPSPGNFASWFIKGSSPDKGVSRQYCFRYNMPLTPADVERLTVWLHENGMDKTPLQTIQKAVDTPIREILQYPIEPVSKRHLELDSNPKNTVALVENMLPEDLSPKERIRALELTRQLQTNIINPNDNLHIPHYFMRNWVSVLKAGPAWIITLLRDKGFQDTSRGVLRDRIKLKNGYEELAITLGVHPRRILEWLPPLEAMVRSASHGAHISTRYKHAKTDAMRQFILEKDGKVDHSGAKHTEYTFRIKLDEPLLPEHNRVFLDVVATMMLAKQGVKQPLTELVAHKSDEERVATENAQVRKGLLPKMHNLPTGWYRIRASLQEVATENAQPLVQTPRDIKDSILKLFNSKVLYEIQQLLRKECSITDQGEAKGKVVVGWNLAQIFEMNGVHTNKIKGALQKIQNDPSQQKRLAAWVLYGYAHRTQDDSQGIDNPALFALSRIDSQPDPTYLSLAELGPIELLDRIQSYWLPVEKETAKVLKLLDDSGLCTLLELAARGNGEV